MFLFFIYNIFSYLGIIFFPVIAKIRIHKNKENLFRINERYGYASQIRPKGELIWIHAASIGEVNCILPLAKNFLAQNKQVLLTTHSLGSVIFLNNKMPLGAIHQMMPFDCPIFIKRFLKHWSPQKVIFVESEIWPNALYYSSKIAEVYMLNFYLVNKNYNQWMFVRPLFTFLLSKAVKIFTSSNQMQNKLLKLISNQKVFFLNHTKYDAALEGKDNVVELLKIKDRFIIVFASTHAGEEKIALQAHLILKTTIPNLLTIIVPRHLKRIEEVKNICKELETVVYPEVAIINSTSEVVIINKIGILTSFYKISNLAIVCGSFMPNIGGHNPLEPATFSKPIIIGQYNYACKEICDEMVAAKAIVVCLKPSDLISKIKEIYQNKHSYLGENALNFVVSRSGSSNVALFNKA